MRPNEALTLCSIRWYSPKRPSNSALAGPSMASPRRKAVTISFSSPGAEHKPCTPRRQHGVLESQRITVKLFPVTLENQRFELLELRRPGVGCQNLEIRVS